MSHFTVLVIGENPEKQLAPFQENNMGDCPKEFLEFNDIEEEYRKQYAEEDAETKESHPTFENYIEDYCGYSKDESTGRYGYFENPNAKWDWFQLGGRWRGIFETKNGKCDQALKGEIDFAKKRALEIIDAKAEYAKAMLIIGGIPINETWDEMRKRIGNVESARELYWAQPRCKAWKENKSSLEFGFNSSPDNYIVSEQEFCEMEADEAGVTFALIKDGVWYEKGKMGWWGMSTDKMTQSEWNKQFHSMISELPDDTLLSMFDCHI
jgi:hypothetical protein